MVTVDKLREAMSRALFLAERARSHDDVPVGAVVIDSLGRIVGEGWNCREADHDPAGHAEIMALRDAGRRLHRWNLVGCTLVVTLEPCTMCAGAAIASRVDAVAFGAWDPKAGAAGSLRDVLRDSRLNHTVEVIPGILAREAEIQLRAFFELRRSPSGAPLEPPAPAPHVTAPRTSAEDGAPEPVPTPGEAENHGSGSVDTDPAPCAPHEGPGPDSDDAVTATEADATAASGMPEHPEEEPAAVTVPSQPTPATVQGAAADAVTVIAGVPVRSARGGPAPRAPRH